MPPKTSANRPRVLPPTPAPQPRRARRCWIPLAIATIVPLVALLDLWGTNIRLGQGFFAYRFSNYAVRRLGDAWPLIPIAAAFVAALLLLASPRRRRLGLALSVIVLLALAVWTWAAPPFAANQHVMNLLSPAQDGAFLREALSIRTSFPKYLRNFDSHIQRSVAAFRGTRVIGNPPGTTGVVFFTEALLAPPPGTVGPIERELVDTEGIPIETVHEIAAAIRFSLVLTVLWALSAIPAYALGRLFLSAPGAALFALVVTFNPCTVNFVPGKDPAQLLTINAMLWAWFAGWRRPTRADRAVPTAAASRLYSIAAGAIFVVGMCFGLIHLWIAAPAWCATAWKDWRERRWHDLAIRSGCAAAGALAVIIAIYLAVGWNMPATMLALNSRWADVQHEFNMSVPIWYVIGLPIFLLFVSPPLCLFAWQRLTRSSRHTTGAALALCTAGFMALSYLFISYELPRLWVAFLPPLTLGVMMDLALPRVRLRRAACALAIIGVVHVFYTAVQWSVFDAREAEYRLLTERFFH